MESILLQNINEEGFEDITELSLSNKNLAVLDIEVLNKLTNLQFLDLSKNQLKLLSNINLPNLKVLNCEDNSISDIAFLSELPALEKLYLNGNPINAADRYIAVDQLPNLQIFDEKSCADIRGIIAHYEKRLNTLASQIFKSKYETILKSCSDDDEIERHRKQCIREVQHKMASFSVTPPKFQRYKVQKLVQVLFKGVDEKAVPTSIKKSLRKKPQDESYRSPEFKNRSQVLEQKSPFKSEREKQKNAASRVLFEGTINVESNAIIKSTPTSAKKNLRKKLQDESYRSPEFKNRSQVSEQKSPFKSEREKQKKAASKVLFDEAINVESNAIIKSTPTKSRKAQSQHINEKDELSYDPHLFLRCHVPRNEPQDSDTPVWGAAFEPDIGNEGKTTDVVATCGGNMVCFISCKTGHVLKRYKDDSYSENFFALAWGVVQVSGNESQKTCVLATGGAGKKIMLIHPSQLKCYRTFKAHNQAINCLQFHPTQATWLFSGSPDTYIHLWDIGALILPNYKTSCQKLMTFETESEVLQFVLADAHNCFFAACSKGLMAWNMAGKTVDKWTRKPSVNLIIPSTCKKETSDLVDGLALVSNDCMAVKVSQSGKIFLWKYSSIFTKGQLTKKKSYEITPIAIYSWSDCNTDYNYLGYCEGSNVLACGDNKGVLWLYDVQKYAANCSLSAVQGCSIPPTILLPWPGLTFENETLSIREKIIVNSVKFNYNGEYIVACTDSNLVCIWRRK